jgi:hypothetical protein
LAEGEIERALELVGLVEEQCLKLGMRRFYEVELLSKLASEVPSDQYSAAVQRGRALDFDETVKHVL